MEIIRWQSTKFSGFKSGMINRKSKSPPSPARPKWADAIAEARKAKGWSQETLGEKVNLSQSAVADWERGKAQPRRATMLLLKELLGIPVHTFFEGGIAAVRNALANAAASEPGNSMLLAQKNGFIALYRALHNTLTELRVFSSPEEFAFLVHVTWMQLQYVDDQRPLIAQIETAVRRQRRIWIDEKAFEAEMLGDEE